MIFKTIDDETTLSGQRIVGIFEARKIAQEQATKQLNTDIQCLKNYENACKSGAVSSEDFTRIMGKASTQAQEYSKNIKDGTGSAQIYADKQKTLQKSIQNTGTASKVAAVGVKALSIAGNMLAGMAISFAISKVIEGIKYLATASERAIEKTKELQQEISQISSDYQSERQTLEGLREEYDALTSKIGENGAEASLSADEYERYRDITSEILGITPKLITGWDEEGRAISNKNGLLQQSIDLLDEEYQKSLRNSTTKSKNKEIAAGIIEQKKDFDNSGDTKTVSGTRYNLVWKDLKNYINEAVANKKINYTYESTGIVGTDDADAAYAINKFVYGDSLYKATEVNTAYGWLGSLQERITSSQENFEKFANSLSNEDNPIYQWFTDEQINELIRDAEEYFQELARIEGEEQQYFQQYKDQLNLNAQAVGDAYSGLDEQTKAGITQMIDSFDYNGMTKEKFSDIATDLKDFVGKLSTDDTLRSYFNNLFKPMGEDESIEDYETRVKTGIDEITSYCESNYPAIKLSFGDVENDVEALKLKYNTAISKFTGDANDVDLGKFFEDNSINDESEIDYWNKVTEGANSAKEAVEMYNEAKSENGNEITVSFSKAFNSLDFSEQKDELLELAKAGELTPETLKSVEGYNELLKQTGLEVREAVKEIYKLVDATDRLSDMSSDLSSLGTAYKEFKEDGFASVNAIESLREKFGELKDFNGNNLFEDFATIVGSASTTAEEKQDAFNKLATSYLLQEKALGKLTEANKNYYITQLKSMGIANAESIVTKQLESEKQALLLKEEALALTSEGINNSSTEKIKALLKEAGATQLCREALFKLHVQEEIFNTSELDPRGKIEALIELATAYGVTSKNIENARKSIEGDKASGGHSGLHFTEADVKRIQEDLDANLLTDSEYVFSAKVDFNIDDKSNGTSKSDTYFDWIETKLDNLNDQLDETKNKAEDSLNGWKVRADAFKDAENQLKSVITTEEQAKARYLEEAKKSGLSQPYIDLVKDGAIDIDKLSNDNPLKEQIESYQEWYDKVKECDEAIDELNADLKQLYRDKREFRWEIFDYLEDSISRITDEADYLIELLSNENLFNDKGHLTKYADATLGLHFSSYDAYMQKAKDYKEEIKDLEGQLATGGQEVLDKYNERVDAHQEAVNAAQQEKQAILDLINDGYQKQLDYLNETIEKRKELWATEKGLYDYQKSIAEKTQNIANLEKRKLALTNDNSEEARAQLQQIEVELHEAKQDLQETEMDKNIEEREKLLDTLSSEYEQWINEKLENSDELLTSIRDSLAPDGEIVNTLKEIAGKNNTFVSDELTSSISDGANSSINSYLGEIIKLLGGDDSFFGNASGKIKGYASGIKRSGKELAWLNENGAEIIRTKDGALLKPLDNSMVFNNESSKRLWEFSQNPSAFLEKMGMNNIIQPIFNIPKLPNIERVSNQTPVNNITHMEVVLPNVTNYDDFMNRMQNDKRFDNIVTASMNSKMTGSNSLSKFRF